MIGFWGGDYSLFEKNGGKWWENRSVRNQLLKSQPYVMEYFMYVWNILNPQTYTKTEILTPNRKMADCCLDGRYHEHRRQQPPPLGRSTVQNQSHQTRWVRKLKTSFGNIRGIIFLSAQWRSKKLVMHSLVLSWSH